MSSSDLTLARVSPAMPASVAPAISGGSIAGRGTLPLSAADPGGTVPRSSIVALLLGGLATAFGIAMAVLDPARAEGWEILHWNTAAVTAFIAVLLSVRAGTGLTRDIRVGTSVSMGLWVAANGAWAVMVATDTVTVPSISDVFAILFLVPGVWMLGRAVHGRLSRAEEIAVYLDDALAFIATAALLIALFGPTAFALGGLDGLLVVVYPTIFIGSAATSFVGVFATQETVRPRGAMAFALGVGMVGLAYAGWIVPTATGQPAHSSLDLLFSIGPLVGAFGALTWGGPPDTSERRLRIARVLTWAIGPLAALITATATTFVNHVREIELFLQGMTALAVILLLVRMALHLQERTQTLREVQRLHAENDALVGRLRRELVERERVQSRLIDASRMSAVGELAAAVAHEVNNPLTGVLGYTELLLGDPRLDPGVRSDLEVVRSEALRVRDRVRSLMDFAAPRRPDRVAVDLASVVSDPIGLLRYHLDRRGITLEERHEPMPQVELDPPSIQQVVINVVTDMAAAMPHGGRIVISTGPAGAHARLAVEADTDDVDVALLAEAFQPLESDAADESGGRIAASLGVVRGHDATLGLHHQPGRRPTVELHLPCRHTPDVD